MPISIRIVGKCDIKFVFDGEKAFHRILRLAIHPDLTIPVARNGFERGIDGVVGHCQVELEPIREQPPLMDRGTAEGINSYSQSRESNCLQIDDVCNPSIYLPRKS